MSIVSPGDRPWSGLDRSLKAVAIAADWPWCATHRRPIWDGSAPCVGLHPELAPKPDPYRDDPDAYWQDVVDFELTAPRLTPWQRLRGRLDTHGRAEANR